MACIGADADGPLCPPAVGVMQGVDQPKLRPLRKLLGDPLITSALATPGCGTSTNRLEVVLAEIPPDDLAECDEKDA